MHPIACRFFFAAALSGLSAGAIAQFAPPVPDAGSRPFPPAADALPITGNIAFTSNYVSRGFTQTWGRPAIQGGIDYAHPSGLYLGTWVSSLSGTEFRGATVEWDLYGGYSSTIGPLGYTAGLAYYHYPGTSSPLIEDRRYDYAELKLALSYGIASLTYYRTLTKDWFGTVSNGRGTGYLDLAANVDLGSGLTLQLHGGAASVAHNSVADWKDAKVGLAKAFDGGWTLTGAWTKAWDKNAYWTGADFRADSSGNTYNRRLGKATLAVTLGKAF